MLGEVKAAVNAYAREQHLDYSQAFDYMLSIAPDFGLEPVDDIAALREQFEARNTEREEHRRQLELKQTADKQHRDRELGRV